MSSLRGDRDGWELLLPDLCRRSVIEPLDEPSGVVGLAEGQQRQPVEGHLPSTLDGIEGPDPRQVLLERPAEARSATVSFRCSDQCWRALDAKEAHLGLGGV